MLKNILLYTGLIICAIFIFHCTNKSNTTFRLPGAANDADEKLEQRELAMLADPATGKIPINVRYQEIAFLRNMQNYNNAQRGVVWQNVGPWNVGGRTRAIALDKTNENIILAASVSGGIWRSTDLGSSWTRVTDPLSSTIGFVSISQDIRAGKENIWYALSGEATGTSASGGAAFFLGDGAMKSIDSGKTWAPITSTNSGTPNSFSNNMQVGWRIATSPAIDSDFVFMAIYGAIVKSNDGGNTWTYSLAPASNTSYYTDLAISKTGILYATLSSDGVSKGFYRSANNGNTWDTIMPTNILSKYDRTVMGINPNNENEVLFFSYLSDSTNVGGTKTSNYSGASEWISLLKYTYISGNGTGTGATWQDLSANLPNNANITSGPFDKLNCQGGYDMYVKIQPTTNAVFIAGTNVFRSDDGFATPSAVQIGGYKHGTTMPYFQIWDNHHPDNHDLVFLPSNYKTIISASDGGIRKCADANIANLTNPAVWTILNNGYLTTQLYSLALDPVVASPWLVGGFQDNGNFMTTNNANTQSTWTDPFNGDGAYNYIAPNHSFLVMSIQQGRVAKFNLDNNGNVLNYKRIDPIGPSKDDYTFINPFAVDPNDNNIMYLPAGKSLYRQNALGSIVLNNTWDSISQGWFKMVDTITAANYGSSGTNKAEITAIAVSTVPANTVYIGTSNRQMYRIDNANGANPRFVNITRSNLPSAGNGAFVSSIAIDPTDANKVLACYSNYGVQSIFYSIDSGFTWKYCGGTLEKNTNQTGVAPSIRWVDILKTPAGSRYFCGTSIGLFSTDTLKAGVSATKDSTVWVQESPNGIGANVVTHITHRQADYTMAVSTHGNGAYMCQYYNLSAISNTNTTVNNVSLYPNPAQNVTTLKIETSNAEQANISVFDLMGRRVQNLGENHLQQGINTITLATANIIAGNYVVIVTQANGKKSAKALIVNH